MAYVFYDTDSGSFTLHRGDDGILYTKLDKKSPSLSSLVEQTH